MDFEELVITSPKRVRRRATGWDAFFPYYAGYPAGFASKLIGSARLRADACIYDPWNGSGTTTFAAIARSYDAIGLDLNPAMIIIARSRSLLPSEADSLIPLAREVIKQADGLSIKLDTEPLCMWFDDSTAEGIRALEVSLRHLLVGEFVTGKPGGRFDRISAVASTFYVALFAACRRAASAFRTSNPTWFKKAREGVERISVCRMKFFGDFFDIVQDMANGLAELSSINERGAITLKLGDSVDGHLEDESVSLVLTSPPYCTRIDYTSATSIELSVLGPLLNTTIIELGRKMIGSTRVPIGDISVKDSWGPTCIKLLEDISNHKSKASGGYYRKTHLDYFSKIDRSLASISQAISGDGSAVMVVQDSYYKDVHNDLPRIVTEMAKSHFLTLRRQEDFALAVTLAASHPHAAKYNRPRGATESVLCFSKH